MTACDPKLKQKPLSIYRMAIVCSVFLLILPGTSAGWTVGEAGGGGSVFLYDQPLEGVYSNNWWGRAGQNAYQRAENFSASDSLKNSEKTMI